MRTCRSEVSGYVLPSQVLDLVCTVLEGPAKSRTSRRQIWTGRSGKTNGIVIEAKMRAGRRRKLFRQEKGWRKPNYAGVSVI